MLYLQDVWTRWLFISSAEEYFNGEADGVDRLSYAGIRRHYTE